MRRSRWRAWIDYAAIILVILAIILASLLLLPPQIHTCFGMCGCTAKDCTPLPTHTTVR
jgi:hypothetical protein